MPRLSSVGRSLSAPSGILNPFEGMPRDPGGSNPQGRVRNSRGTAGACLAPCPHGVHALPLRQGLGAVPYASSHHDATRQTAATSHIRVTPPVASAIKATGCDDRRVPLPGSVGG
ncbi:hypothetical protein U9M48_012490 [Paspalum notatum var. saurae]|uniref:Uncharacterized protein n=1 Tax=Paspalum notatum var. saurae TaxID=547442 RepID=A0AAQ3WIL5_PASNO